MGEYKRKKHAIVKDVESSAIKARRAKKQRDKEFEELKKRVLVLEQTVQKLINS